MNIESSQLQFSPEDKRQYAVLSSFLGAIASGQMETVSEKAIVLSPAGQWSVINEPVDSSIRWTLHLVMQTPTLEILEKIASKLYPLVGNLPLHIHKSSDWHTGQVGFVVAIQPENATKLTNSNILDELGTEFQMEVALIQNAPYLAKSGLLLMDMDSTVIATECIDEIALLAGAGDKVSEVTEQAMRGELDFAESLKSRVACLQGLEQSALDSVRDKLPLMPGLTRLINQLNVNHWYIAIASGGFTYFADHLKERLGLDEAIANNLAIEDGILTGLVEGQIVDADVKAQSIETLSQRWQIPASQTVAMGDGANDLKMMSKANLGIAYKAKPIVQASADSGICFTGLDTALFFMR